MTTSTTRQITSGAMTRYWTGTSFKQTWTPPEGALYAAWQVERAPSTDKLHTQWFVAMTSRTRFTTMKRLLHGDHIEIARVPSKARDYCMKSETRVSGPHEHGVWTQETTNKRGLQDSAASIVDSIRLAPSATAIVQEHPTLWRQFRTIQALKQDLQSPRRHTTSGIYLSGSTGRGKTKICLLIAEFLLPTEVFWMANAQPGQTQWWDGYAGQRLVIWDEYRGTTAQTLLRICDRTPYRVPVKGSSIELKAAMIFFTSNLSLPETFTHLDDPTLKAIKRRILMLNVY